MEDMFFPDLLDVVARDLGRKSLSHLSPKELKQARNDVLSGLLSADNCGSSLQDLQYVEFFAKAKVNARGFEPESPLPCFIDFQTKNWKHPVGTSAYLSASDKELDTYQSLLRRLVGGPVLASDLVRAMRHGPGTTFSGLRSYDKWLQTRGRHLLSDLMDPLNRLPLPPHGGMQTSKFMEVPKTMWVNRGICAEEAHLQFVQQGIGRILARRLRPFADVSKQWNNIQAAMRDGWCTLDLSMASDSVTTDHVPLHWSEHDPATRLEESSKLDLIELMWRYRSQWVLVHPRNEEAGLIELSSFCTMGNGFCFPLLTASSIAIVLMAICQEYSVSPYAPMPKLRTLFHENASVYGDDIVVSPRILPWTRWYLARMGFTLNVSKSSEPQARLKETCGAFILDGKAYTNFIRLRDGSLSSIDSYLHLADLQRRAHERGWRRTARYLHETIVSRCQGLADSVNPDVGLVDRTCFDSTLVTFSSTETAVRRYQKRYHRTVVDVLKKETPLRDVNLGDTVAWAHALWSEKYVSAFTAEPDLSKEACLRIRTVPTHW